MKRLLVLGALCAALAGCATGPVDPLASLPASTSVSVTRANEAADVLVRALAAQQGQMGPVLVASVAKVDDLGASSTFGRVTGEQLAARMAARGFAVVEPKVRGSMLMSQKGGEFMLSRVAKETGSTQKVQVVIAGTYAAAGQQVMVTLKAIDLETNRVLSGYSYAVPRAEVYGMLD